MSGIDLYDRYQDVIDWAAVKTAGVNWVYVKGTDGSGRAVVPADDLVAGAKRVGLRVGLYHFVEKTPSPAIQANVLADEVNRLGATGMPPCIDFEGSLANDWSAAQCVDFVKRFITQLRVRGFTTVTLYANRFHLGKLNPDSWRDPDLRIWYAYYGVNDGKTYPGLGGYAGRVDYHQWTDNGTVPGIEPAGNVDLNKTLLEDSVATVDAITDDVVAKIATGVWGKILGTAGAHAFLTVANANTWEIKAGLKQLGVDLDAVQADVDELQARPVAPPAVVDVPALAAALHDLGIADGPNSADLAADIAANLTARLAA